MSTERLRGYFSHSRLSSFEDCAKKYEYRYVLQVPSDTESIEGFVGKRVHEVLERLYIATGKGHVPTLPQVLKRYNALFDAAYDADKIRIVKTENSADDYRAIGERSLSNYYRRHYPFDGDETLAIEEHVVFDLDLRGEYGIQGFVDRISRARDGAIEIHDYKTSRFVPNQQKLDQDRQLAFYQLGIAGKYATPDTPVRLVWHYVQRNQTRTSTRSPEELTALRSDTIALIDRIRAATAFEPRTSNLCSWCEYNDICPAMATSARATATPHVEEATPAPPIVTPVGTATTAAAPRQTAPPLRATMPARAETSGTAADTDPTAATAPDQLPLL